MTFLILDMIIGIVAFVLAVVPAVVIICQDARRGQARPVSDVVIEAEGVLVGAEAPAPVA